MLSADLCLRMLPAVATNMSAIDADDPLIAILEKYLKQFHYSGIGHLTGTEGVDFSLIGNNACLAQLYTDRIIERKDKLFAKRPEIALTLSASLGNYKQYFLND
jgi:hypothetical protein